MLKARLICSVLAAQMLAGCSYLVVRPPPKEEGPVPYYACTGRIVAPVMDTVLAVSDAVAAPYYAMGNNNHSQYANAALAGSLLGVAVFGSSAVYGYYETARCREAQATAGPAMAAPYGPPPAADYVPAPPVFGACAHDIDCPAGTLCAKGACVPAAP